MVRQVNMAVARSSRCGGTGSNRSTAILRSRSRVCSSDDMTVTFLGLGEQGPQALQAAAAGGTDAADRDTEHLGYLVVVHGRCTDEDPEQAPAPVGQPLERRPHVAEPGGLAGGGLG